MVAKLFSDGLSRAALFPRLVAVSLLLGAPIAVPAAGNVGGAEEHPGWEKSGDLLQWGIPLAGLGLSFLLNGAGDGDSVSGLFDQPGTPAPGLNWPGPRLDRTPRQDFLVSFLRMELSTYALKYSINAQRPNGGGQSFPSGHSSASFMGAEFIRKQYGNAWGAPAYAAASWVGYTRVESHNHYWRDVIGGAVVGVVSNYDFDHIDTPIGEISFGPATFVPDFSAWPGQDDPLGGAPLRLPPPVPGLRFALRF